MYVVITALWKILSIKFSTFGCSKLFVGQCSSAFPENLPRLKTFSSNNDFSNHSTYSTIIMIAVFEYAYFIVHKTTHNLLCLRWSHQQKKHVYWEKKVKLCDNHAKHMWRSHHPDKWGCRKNSISIYSVINANVIVILLLNRLFLCIKTICNKSLSTIFWSSKLLKKWKNIKFWLYNWINWNK